MDDDSDVSDVMSIINTAHDNEVFHVPNCEKKLKPVLGQGFPTLKDASNFYHVYAASSGFDVRKGTKSKCPRDGTVRRLLLYCNREGTKNAIADDGSKKKRRRPSNRVGCKARIAFKFDASKGFIVDLFEERHNHALVSEEFKKYLKGNRKLNYVQYNFIMSCAKANIGPTKAYRLFKEFIGDYSGIGSRAIDWRNFSRDLRAFVDGCDAQLILQKMTLKQESESAFFYSYSVDKDDRLTCIFWADSIAQRNFHVFGDVVSFDSTYQTNRYNMIFAPFTGKDNHGKIVTFGASLISGENHKKYEWVFDEFKKCMGRAPRLIITDQDPAMKIALDKVMPESTHRLCMWHIMMKVTDKLPTHLKQDETFKKRLNDTVWTDLIDTSEFEKQWNKIMVDFDLQNADWFQSLYDIREQWIPAYFRDIPMSGLCRTTSISESVNSFFKHYLNKNGNLVEFVMHFESAIDAQRHANDLLNYRDCSEKPLLKTPLDIEKHAAAIYTTSLFIKVQEEIEETCFRCNVLSVQQHVEGKMYEVSDGSKHSHSVLHNTDDSIVCSCNKFVRDGWMCSHMFVICKLLDLKTIPDKYIVARWTKEAYKNPVYDARNASFYDFAELDDSKRTLNTLISDFYACVGAIQGDDTKLESLKNSVRVLKESLIANQDDSSLSAAKSKMYEAFYGIPKPDEVVVLPPAKVRNKGCASDKKSKKFAAIKRAMKPPRRCSKCGQLGDHDARNCPY